MSGLATTARTITWQRKPRRANLTACAPGVDVASPTLLFPAKQALGDRLVDKAPDGLWSWAALSVCCEGKVASSQQPETIGASGSRDVGARGQEACAADPRLRHFLWKGGKAGESR